MRSPPINVFKYLLLLCNRSAHREAHPLAAMLLKNPVRAASGALFQKLNQLEQFSLRQIAVVHDGLRAMQRPDIRTVCQEFRQFRLNDLLYPLPCTSSY